MQHHTSNSLSEECGLVSVFVQERVLDRRIIALTRARVHDWSRSHCSVSTGSGTCAGVESLVSVLPSVVYERGRMKGETGNSKGRPCLGLPFILGLVDSGRSEHERREGSFTGSSHGGPMLRITTANC